MAFDEIKRVILINIEHVLISLSICQNTGDTSEQELLGTVNSNVSVRSRVGLPACFLFGFAKWKRRDGHLYFSGAVFRFNDQSEFPTTPDALRLAQDRARREICHFYPLGLGGLQDDLHMGEVLRRNL